MRIAYFTETYPPEINGVSLTVERCVGHLRHSDNSVLLCRPRQPGEAQVDDTNEWRTPGVRLPMYPDLRMGLALSASVRRRLEGFEPDLVHVATPGPLGSAAVAAARDLLVPVTSDFRTNFHTYCAHYGLGFAGGLVLHYLRRFHNRTAVTFVPSRVLRAELQAQGFKRVEVMARGVDGQLFNPRKRSEELRDFWDARSDAPVLLYVGRLASEKNVVLALRTYLTLLELHPDARMVVVGDGPLRAQLEDEYPLVHFAGPLRGQSLAIHYASSDVFLFPSLTETFGNVTLEAMASGLAIVAFDVAAASEWIRDETNGLLAPPGDENAFMAAAVRALAPEFPLAQLRACARASMLAADWQPLLRAFELRLGQIACAIRVQDAVVA
ncbi:MAG TPA: glycosyltransferase family 1 protein [Burkholderiaceae bacterium]|nr:glycosyltransferase family 1 protein [Burkholderiaceae bacterium]